MPWALLLVLVLSLALRVPLLALPLTPDEGAYAYVGFWAARGQSLYTDVWVDRPQGLLAFYAVAVNLLGGAPEVIRLLAGLLNVTACALIYGIGTHWYGRPTGLAAAASYAFLSAHPRLDGIAANGELLMALPAVASLWCLLRSGSGKDSLGWLAAAGVCTGAAFLMKQTGIATFLVAASWLLWNTRPLTFGGTRNKEQGTRDRSPEIARSPQSSVLSPPLLRSGALLGAGALTAVLPAILHGVALGPAEYWSALAGHRLARESALAYPLVLQLAWLVRGTVAVLPALVPALFLAAWTLQRRDCPPLLGLWLGWNAAALTLGGEWWTHYFIQIAPPLAVLAGRGAVLVAAAPRNRTVRLWRGLALGLLVFTVLDYGSFLSPASPEARAQRYSVDPRFPSTLAIASFVRERTSAAATVYVAYEGPEILYLAQRRSPVRSLFRAELFDTPGAYDELLQVLADPERRPDVVVTDPVRLSGPGGPGDSRFLDLLQREYVPVASFGSYVVTCARVAPQGGCGAFP